MQAPAVGAFVLNFRSIPQITFGRSISLQKMKLQRIDFYKNFLNELVDRVGRIGRQGPK
jgi:hypothetical protein